MKKRTPAQKTATRGIASKTLASVPILTLTLLGSLAFAGAGLAQEATTEKSAGFFDRAAYTAHQKLTQTWLASEQAGSALAAPIRVELAPAERVLADTTVIDEGRLRVGVAKDLALGFDFSGLAALDLRAGAEQPFARGAVRRSPKGDLVWSAAVRSEGATAMRLHFTDFSLPQGAELYVYNAGNEAFGPYTGRGLLGTGDFWSHTLIGDEARIQLRLPADARGERQAAGFTLAGAGHLGSGWVPGILGGGLTKSFCSFNESCVENASCSSVPAAIQAASDAIAHIQFVSGAFLYICSGGLVADTDPNTQIPYFLTANHCINKNGQASSLEAFFQFTTPCNGACYNPDGAVPRTVGSTIKSTNRTSDYTLLQLSQSAPAGSAFLGWSTTAVANSNGTALYRLSHPSGAPQAYSRHSVDTSAGTCTSWPRGNWIYSRDTFGATEGGSSGSPVLNASGQIVGQLSGACGFNVNDVCDSTSNATVDGAFAAYYSQVAQFLDPAPCTDADGDGWCAGVDCNDNNANVSPGASEVCGDSLDNDCDGAVDEGCSACMPSGASCTSNSQCCSNRCRGPGGNKTCQ